MASNPPLYDVFEYLLTNVPLGLTSGEGGNFHASILRDDIDQQYVLNEFPGAEGDETFGTSLPAVEETRFQIMCRDSEDNYATNQTAIQAFYRTIYPIANITINGTLYLRWLPLHSPAFINRDDKRRPIHVLNFYTLRSPV